MMNMNNDVLKANECNTKKDITLCVNNEEYGVIIDALSMFMDEENSEQQKSIINLIDKLTEQIR